MVEQIQTCSSGRTPHQSRWMPKGGCDPMRDPPWRSLFLKDCDPIERTSGKDPLRSSS